MSLDVAVQTFLTESHELLDAMEQALLCLESDPHEAGAIDSLFRTAHTIKGSSGLFSFDQTVAFTHVLENTLERLRSRKIELSVDLLSTLLKSRDHISQLIDAEVQSDEHQLQKVVVAGLPLLKKLQQHLEGHVEVPSPQRSANPTENGTEVENLNWHLSLRFHEDMLKSGMDPVSFIACLGKLGRIASIATVSDTLPDLQEMDPESLYLGFEVALDAATDRAHIESVFEFVLDEMQLQIFPPHAKLSQYARLIRDLSDQNLRLGDILVNCKALTPRELEMALKLQADSSEPKRLGEILVDATRVPQDVINTALSKQTEVREKKDKEPRSIRVDADKLDQLINLVGELVVAESGSKLIARRSGSREMTESMDILAVLVENIRDSVLQLRMVQIGETFKRFRRVVRDVSHDLGKDINLEITGGETEMDKAMVERIADPLTHLVRNSLDHGIEPTEVRLARGKPATGTLRLHAYHNSGYVVVEISDDGGGINRQRVLARARERHIIEADATPTDSEIFLLIFEPGFSTKETVTDLSGRGVGMDVVKRNIESLRGTVEITSVEGQGTTVRLQLPLTLAMIDGFLVRIENSTYVIPLESVLECFRYSSTEKDAKICKNYVNLRGAVLPFVRLREMFAHTEASANDSYIVVVQFSGERVGLMVDEVLGEFQTVIKPLGKLFRQARGISGATVLGTGEVALILDVPDLIRKVVGQNQRGLQTAALASATAP